MEHPLLPAVIGFDCLYRILQYFLVFLIFQHSIIQMRSSQIYITDKIQSTAFDKRKCIVFIQIADQPLQDSIHQQQPSQYKYKS